MLLLPSVLLALSCYHLCAASDSQGGSLDTFFLDSRDNAYLREKQEGIRPSLDGDSSSLLAVLLGVIPPKPLSAAGSEQLSTIVKPSPFKKPRAHAAFTIAGLSAGKQLKLALTILRDKTQMLHSRWHSMQA
ncbi:hypothetical protein DUNSADRAFT_16638 [Dunaliella salina]|uniref:DUF7794 domain-containing protein n=1 Tax=Dunaliella salina TaxID=3046 RepID=A0ABQ7G380_DUNSA|nr:hypothetical protein DUNSADRAFT_16638 [Dunaliella salina]|eukprot:KAF5829054.1 hypothetical protein DUNSADRAFT_16638 [Dunaliella salina]